MVNIVKNLSEISGRVEFQYIANLFDSIIGSNQYIYRFLTKNFLTDAVWGLARRLFYIVIQGCIAHSAKTSILRNAFVWILFHVLNSLFVYAKIYGGGRGR